MHDLVVRNGLVIDGTGASRRRADVAVSDGRIAALGRFSPGEGRRVIDAEGCVVAPGFIDPHTHYDPQLTLDPFASSSCFHGVTSVVVGNCGFGLAPTRAAGRESVKRIFARVEEIGPAVLDHIPWDFETFPELLRSREGKLGVNAAWYVAHSNVRLWALGEAAYDRAATDDEIASMRGIVREAMAAGAAGFSSSHSPTDLDTLDRPVPSRRASHDELVALAEEAGRANRGSIAYLPKSAIGGHTPEDGELMLRIALGSRLPVIVQGLGARSKVDSPDSTWPESKQYLEHARAQGAAIYSLLMSRPFRRPFSLARGTTLFEGALAFHRLFTEASTVPERCAMLRDPHYRDAIRDSVENPNRDPDAGSMLPLPSFAALSVNRVAQPQNEPWIGRTLAGLAAERGESPIDTLLDLALSEDLATEFLWSTENEKWRNDTYQASAHPQMIIGTSDGGAHLGRDDGAETHSFFLRYWVREWGRWELEAAIRELTLVPASILGLVGRGLIAPGWAADLVVFDPDTVGPGTREFCEDRIAGQQRWSARPVGVRATIVNGVPIVQDGEIDDERARPGVVLRPGASS